MNTDKHPLIIAYDIGALDSTMSTYIKWFMLAALAPNEEIAHYYLNAAEALQDDMTTEHINLGRHVADLILAYDERMCAA